jgi:hypothetical protein
MLYPERVRKVLKPFLCLPCKAGLHGKARTGHAPKDEVPFSIDVQLPATLHAETTDTHTDEDCRTCLKRQKKDEPDVSTHSGPPPKMFRFLRRMKRRDRC